MSSENNTLTLAARHYGKLGVLHCGVTRIGLIAVVGDQRDIADGESITFDRVGITASRNDDTYTFVKH